MKTFMLSVLSQIEVEAPTQADAQEAVLDCFGEGETCGLTIVETEIIECDELY